MNITNDKAVTASPAVAIFVGPRLSEIMPDSGAMIMKPAVIGSIRTPAQNGVLENEYPFIGSQIPCSRITIMNIRPPIAIDAKRPAKAPDENRRILKRSILNMG